MVVIYQSPDIFFKLKPPIERQQKKTDKRTNNQIILDITTGYWYYE